MPKPLCRKKHMSFFLGLAMFSPPTSSPAFFFRKRTKIRRCFSPSFFTPGDLWWRWSNRLSRPRCWDAAPQWFRRPRWRRAPCRCRRGSGRDGRSPALRRASGRGGGERKGGWRSSVFAAEMEISWCFHGDLMEFHGDWVEINGGLMECDGHLVEFNGGWMLI